MRIAGLNKFSTFDYPGRMSSVIYTPGCDFNCWWCPHPEYLEANCPLIPEEEVMDFLRNRNGMVEAVVISGGEPTLQADLAQFIRTCRHIGYLISLRTNGSNPRVVEGFLSERLVHRVEINFKAPTDQYSKFGGFHGDAVLQTIDAARRSRTEYAVRTVVRPDMTENEIERMSRETGETAEWILLPYGPPGASADDVKKAQDLLPVLGAVLEKTQPNVRIGRRI